MIRLLFILILLGLGFACYANRDRILEWAANSPAIRTASSSVQEALMIARAAINEGQIEDAPGADQGTGTAPQLEGAPEPAAVKEESVQETYQGILRVIAGSQ